jgi:YD repeat-containing protein
MTTRAGQPINFTYDDRSRLRSRASPSETATFLYHLGGRMTHAQNSAATLDFGYDARDQLKTETTNIPGLATQIVQHDYGPAGNRTRLTYPDGVYVDVGLSVTVGHDDNGWFATAKGPIGLGGGVSVDPFGTCPVQPEDFHQPVPPDTSFGMAGFYAEAGVSVGPVGGGVEGVDAVGIASTEDGGVQAAEISKVDGGMSLSGERGFGVSAEVSGGVTVTIGGVK